MKATVNALIEISLYAAAVTGAILLFRALFRKRVSPRLQYLVWGLLILRLALPVTFESGLHVESLFPQAPAAGVTAQADLPGAGAVTPRPVAQTPPVAGEAPRQAGEQGAQAPAQAKAAKPFDPYAAAFRVWLGGIAAFAAWMAFGTLRHCRRMKALRAATPNWVCALYDECRAALGVEREIRLWVVDAAMSPGVALFGKPALLIPAAMLASPDQLRFALLHELTHIRRRDHLAQAAINVLRAAYWFNPLVHLAFFELISDMECACDADVIAFINPGEKRGYLAAILSLFSFETQPQLGFAQFRTQRMAKRRIRGAFMRTAASRGARLAAAALALALALTCFTTACQPTPEVEIVVNKEGDEYESRADDMPVAEQIGFTGHLQGEFTLTDKLSLNVDAALETYAPLEDHKVYGGTLYDFTQQEAEALAGLFVPGVAMAAYDGRMTKESILEWLLMPAKRDLADAEAGKVISDDGGPKSVEELRQGVEMYQKWYDEAPETIVPQPIDISSYTANGNYFYGEFPIEGSAFCGRFALGYGERNRTGGMFYNNAAYDLYEQHNIAPTPKESYSDHGNYGQSVSIRITEEQAIRIATELRDQMGADELTYAFAVPAKCWTGDLSTGDLNAYWIVFQRRIDGIPVLDIGEVGQTSKYGGSQTFERLVVTVSDEGVLAVNWMGPTRLTGAETEKPRFATLARIFESVKNGILARNSYDSFVDTELESLYADISAGRLMYVRLKQPDGGARDVRFIPAWVFDVDYTRIWTDKSLAGNPYLTKQDTYRDILVINALDGSFVEPAYPDGVMPEHEYDVMPMPKS